METQINKQDMSVKEPAKKGKGKFILIFVIILVLLGIGIGRLALTPKEGSPESISKEVEKVVKEVSKVMVLPKGEEPTVGTITDPSAFEGQAFFEGAVKGDKILVYPNKGMIILYSSSQGKILGVAPLSLGVAENATAPVPKSVANEKTTGTDSEE